MYMGMYKHADIQGAVDKLPKLQNENTDVTFLTDIYQDYIKTSLNTKE